MATIEEFRSTVKLNWDLELRRIRAYQTLSQNETDEDLKMTFARKFQERIDMMKVVQEVLATIEANERFLKTFVGKIQKLYLKNGLEVEERFHKLMQIYERQLEERQEFLNFATEGMNRTFSSFKQDVEKLEAAAAKYA